VWIAAVLVELPWHSTPEIDSVPRRSITIIGDSVTAGVGSDETSERWPQILEREHGIAVHDMSHVEETAASALKRVRSHKVDSPIVVVEIGGNDLLGGTPSADRSADDLDALLDHVTTADCQVVMFELPSPPFHNEYGRIQRLAAKRHNVHLIPRRRFLSVLAAGDATLDTIYLSQAGHIRMDDCVWGVVHTAFDSDSP
jgi:acyl-CoA thioesterase-1